MRSVQHWTRRNGVALQKRGYPNRRTAVRALAQTCNRNGWRRADYDVYKCRFCRQYHFGRIPRRSRKGEARRVVS
jgi:hypothetical protein